MNFFIVEYMAYMFIFSLLPSMALCTQRVLVKYLLPVFFFFLLSEMLFTGMATDRCPRL